MPQVNYTPAKGLHQTSGIGLNMNYLDFMSGNLTNLTATGATITDDQGDAGEGGDAAAILAATLVAGAVNTFAGDASAAQALYLPVCEADTHCVLQITGDLDEASAITINTRGAVDAGTSVVLSKQVIGPLHQGAAASSVATAGTVAAPTSVSLVYTPAAADTNFLGANSFVHFYAPQKDRWMVKIFNVPEGAGNTGALTVA